MTATLEARDLVKSFTVRRNGKARIIDAVNHVSLKVASGEIVGLVGESGSGKTTVARILIGIETPTDGEVSYAGSRVESQDDWRALRRRVQYVFQDPFTALCPTMRIGDALAEPLAIHRICPRSQRAGRVADMLKRVGLDPDIRRRLPAQLSGGQRQRVNLARALMLQPETLICDEIVSGLDVSVQAQVLQLLLDLQRELSISLIFISHDLRVIRYMCDRVLVMYMGQIVEQGPTTAVFDDPRHSYTQSLLAAIPGNERSAEASLATGSGVQNATRAH